MLRGAVLLRPLQAGIDDAAKAAGLAVGHLESSAEAVAQKVGVRGAEIKHVVQFGLAAGLARGDS